MLRPGPIALSGFLVLTAASACADTGSGDAGIIHPTLIAVSPEDFLGGVPCVPGPGAMQRYVATLYDVTDAGPDGGAPFVLPSTPPTGCTQTAVFGFVVPGRRYLARVEGYDRTDLQQLAPGSASLFAVGSGDFVEPRWTGLCSGRLPASDAAAEGDAGGEAGSSDGGASSECEPPDPLSGRENAVPAVEFVTRRISACTPLCDRRSGSPTGLSVDITSALAGIECGTNPGQLASFRVTRRGSSEPPKTAACGEEVSFVGLDPGRDERFDVAGFEAEAAAPRWGTVCFGVPLAGAISSAGCDPLTTVGGIDVDVPALLAAAGVTCAETRRVIASLSATDGAMIGESTPPDCAALGFSSLPPAFYSIDVSIEFAAGGSRGASCEAVVSPGLVTRAACTLLAAAR